MPSALHPVRVSERASTTAASYLPRRVAEAYASADPPAPPCVSPFHSVLLFADVTGYSSLTRGLERSDDGCWAASQLLNAVRAPAGLLRARWPQESTEEGAAACETLRGTGLARLTAPFCLKSSALPT